MRHRSIIAIIFVCMFSTGAVCQDAIPGGALYKSDFIIDGIPRSFTFYLPYGYGKYESYSLLIMLPDSASDNLIKNYGALMHAFADSIHTIIIYPDAVGEKWNYDLSADAVNDLSFFSILIDYLEQQYLCNPQQVYAAGTGNGALMVQRLGCSLPAKITAIAPFFSGRYESVCPQNSVDVMDTSAFLIPGSKKLTEAMINSMWNFLF